MILSKRERYIAIASVLGIAVLALDFFLLSPLLDRRATLELSLKTASDQLDTDTSVVSNSARIKARWAEMKNAGLDADATIVERDVINSLTNWAKGLNITNGPKPERTENMPKQKEFRLKTFRVTATGPMRAISEFLWRIQTSKLPLRITDMNITARKEGTDDLQIELGVSTIYYIPVDPNKSPKTDLPLAYLGKEKP